MIDDPAAFLRQLFNAAVAAADPMRVVLPRCRPPAGRVIVVGAGKASARMAEAVEASWGPCGASSSPAAAWPSDPEYRDRRGGASGADANGPPRRARMRALL